MIPNVRADSLKAKHAALDNQISEEERRPLPDTALIYDLKKQKLKIKDELNEISVH